MNSTTVMYTVDAGHTACPALMAPHQHPQDTLGGDLHSEFDI